MWAIVGLKTIIPLHALQLLLVDRIEADGTSDPLGIVGRAKVVQDTRIAENLQTTSTIQAITKDNAKESTDMSTLCHAGGNGLGEANRTGDVTFVQAKVVTGSSSGRHCRR
jgi:hypothetical protein